MSDNIPNTLSARQAEHDPNFMLSLARGLEVCCGQVFLDTPIRW
ncbi:hypothetical protein SK89_02729 [Klebsiella pneumoniae]|nr:hypothetical protein SK89_02729 [Klebsiella pneumoniae]